MLMHLTRTFASEKKTVRAQLTIVTTLERALNLDPLQKTPVPDYEH